MALINTFEFTKTVVDGEKLLKATRNQYRLVAQRPYQSKKVPEYKGITITLQVIADDMDYGLDKKTGKPRETNLFEAFDVTVLNGQDHIPVKKGEFVALAGFIPEKSFAIGFDLILRFRKRSRNSMSKQSRLVTKQERNGEMLVMVIAGLAGLAAGTWYLSSWNLLGSQLLLYKATLISGFIAIIVTIGWIAYWCCINHVSKGIKYAWRHYGIKSAVEYALFKANIYVTSLDIFNTSEVAVIPRVRLSFSSDLRTGTLKIANEIQFDKKLENLRLSSALGKYVVTQQYLTDDQNWYEYELIDSSVQRQLKFDNLGSFLAYNTNFTETDLFLDNLVKQLPLSSALIVGQTGAGKTRTLEEFVLQMINKPIPYKMYFVDPKQSEIAVMGKKISPHHIAVNLDEIINHLNSFVAELNGRQTIMYQR